MCREKQLKYDDIRDLILSEEVRRRDANIDNAQDQAFVMENKSKGRSRGPNDQKLNGRSQSRDRSQFKETRECCHCGKKGHLRRDCWLWNKEIVGIGIRNKIKENMERMIVRKIL